MVLTGHLVAYALAENGSAVNLFAFEENAVIGANPLFGEHGAYPHNIYAVSDCALVRITKNAVTELLHDHDFVLKYIQSLSSNSLFMNRRIIMFTQKTLRENLMDYLRDAAAAQGSNEIRLPISKKELADRLGVQRPSLFRAFKKLREEGVISGSNRSIRLIERGSECADQERDV